MFWRIKKYFHRRKIFKSILDGYYSWDHVGTIPETISAYVIDFWENGGMDHVSYEVDEHFGDHWKVWYDRFYRCYVWFKWMKPMYYKFGEKMLDEAYNRTSKLPFEEHFEKVPGSDGKFVMQLAHNLTDEEQEKSDWYRKIEDFIRETDIYYLKEVMELHTGMWT